MRPIWSVFWEVDTKNWKKFSYFQVGSPGNVILATAATTGSLTQKSIKGNLHNIDAIVQFRRYDTYGKRPLFYLAAPGAFAVGY